MWEVRLDIPCYWTLEPSLKCTNCHLCQECLNVKEWIEDNLPEPSLSYLADEANKDIL